MRHDVMTFAVVCTLLSTAPSAHADTYRYLSKDDDGAATFIDETTINRNGDTTTVWLLTITGEYLRGRTPLVAYYLIQQSLNCRTQRIRPAAMSTFSENGTRVHTDDAGAEEGPIEPGTIEQDIFKIACQQKKAAAGSFKAGSPHTLAREFRNDVLKLKGQW